jgi:Uma2 family endonuclease
MAVSAVKPVTAEEFFEFCGRPENEDGLFELERGEIVEVNRPGERHGFVCTNVVGLLRNYVIERGRGFVVSNDTGVIVERKPDSVKGPDAALYDESPRYEDLSPTYSHRIPALVVEVLSPTDRPGKIAQRVSRFLNAGVQLVWLIDPDARNVTVFRSGQNLVVFERDDHITGLDVLPDLRLRVAEFFLVPGEPTE